MNNKRIEYVQDMMIMIMNHLFLSVFAIGIVGLFKEKSLHLEKWWLAFLYPLAFYAVRLWVKHLIPFLVLHLLIPATVFCLPFGLLFKLPIFVMGFIYALVSMNIQYRDDVDVDYFMSPMGVIGVMGVASLVDYFIAKNGWEQQYLIMAVIYLCMYFVCYFLSQYLFVRVANKSSAGMIPEKAIFRTGMRQTIFFSVGSAAVLLLTANIEWVAYILSWVWKGVYLILATIISWLPKGNEDTGVMEEPVRPNRPKPQLPDVGEMENSILTKFWKLLEQIVLIILVIAIVRVLVVLIKKGWKYLKNNFGLLRRKKVTKDKEVFDLHESCSIEKSERAGTDLFALLSPRERVRRMFRKKVQKNRERIIGKRSESVLGTLTANECCEKLSDWTENADVLARVYEKARYSQDEITAEDVRRAKTVK